jgi:hypothetical protein
MVKKEIRIRIAHAMPDRLKKPAPMAHASP